MSFDTPEENKAFKEAESFPFPLLSDPDRAVGQLYGTAREQGEDWADFAKRKSFLIDPEGVVVKTYAVRDVNAHPDEVLADLRALQGAG
jgi:peroxiredoxin Q/BCP